MSVVELSNSHYNRGVDLDNAGRTAEAIQEYTKAIELNNHPMAYYSRACIYQDLRKFKEAIEDFQNYLKYGPESSQEAIASRVCIEELQNKLAAISKIQGERSELMCPICRCNLVIVEKNVGGFKGSKKLRCPECGQTIVKM